jgi:putative transposase
MNRPVFEAISLFLKSK